MDIRSALLKEHSKEQCIQIVKYIGSDKNRFSELIEVFFAGGYRLTQRAAWPLSYCVQAYPVLIQPYFDRLILMLHKPGVHNAVARNILRMFQEVEIPNRYHGSLMTTCFEYVSDPKAAAAVKAFSMTILFRLSKRYPEIRSELKLIIEERWQQETPAFRSRAKRILPHL